MTEPYRTADSRQVIPATVLLPTPAPQAVMTPTDSTGRYQVLQAAPGVTALLDTVTGRQMSLMYQPQPDTVPQAPSGMSPRERLWLVACGGTSLLLLAAGGGFLLVAQGIHEMQPALPEVRRCLTAIAVIVVGICVLVGARISGVLGHQRRESPQAGQPITVNVHTSVSANATAGKKVRIR